MGIEARPSPAKWACGIGALPLIAAVPAVLGAIGNAVGVMPHRTPCTPQRVWELLHPQQETATPYDARLTHAPPHARAAK